MFVHYINCTRCVSTHLLDVFLCSLVDVSSDADIHTVYQLHDVDVKPIHLAIAPVAVKMVDLQM